MTTSVYSGSARPPSSTGVGKKKRRRMKQMEGLLLMSRPKLDDAALAAMARNTDDQLKPRVVKPKKVHVMLQPQQLQLAYSAQDDQEMKMLLGRVDLVGAKLEQAPDGFVIHSESGAKKLKLHDKDKATIDAWFFAVYAAITEFERTPIDATPADMAAWMFSGVLSGSFRDEATDGTEYELSCQLVIPSRSIGEPSIRWKVWRTAQEIHFFDDELRRIPSVAPLLRDVLFPRDRKRDSIFGGLRRKSMHELKEQQLSVYIGRVFTIRQLSSDPAARVIIRRFLRFDDLFELSCEQVVDNNVPSTETSVETLPPTTPQVEPTEYPTSTESFSAYSQGDETNNESSNSRAQEPAETFELPADTFEAPPPLTSEPQTRLSRSTSVHFDDEFEELPDVTPEADPVAAKKLHKQIIHMVRDVFGGDEDRVRDFQDQTKDFGRDKTDAKEYCAFLHGALGSKQSCIVIPLMARLMPDDDKRLALMEARAAIIRKTARRNRRRSKQFSESVVMQQHQHEQRQANQQNEWLSSTTTARTRPKSESHSAVGPSQAPLSASYYGQRSSMVEPRSLSNPSETSGFQRLSLEESGRKSLPDARRKLDSRRSLSMFGEPIHTDRIEEESSGARDSEDRASEREGSEDHTYEKHPVSPSPEMKPLPPVFRRASSNSWLQHPHSGGGAPSSQPGYGQRALRTRQSSRSVESIGNVSSVGDHEEQPPADEVEENPVLARLKKQGAVSFMLR